LFSRTFVCLSTLLLTVSGLASGSASSAGADEVQAAETENEAVPFKYAAGHILLIPVKVCGKNSTFVLDTGCGVNVVSQSLADSLSCKVIGKHSGRRMSGQKLSMEIAALPSLQVGSYVQQNVPVAKWKLEDLLGGEKELASVKGFVSLDFFKDCAFTMDYAKKLLFIETEATLKQRLAAGKSVSIKVTGQGSWETGIDVPLEFSNGKTALAEVDTGSGSLILDAHYMKAFGINETDANVKVKNGTDETGHSYKRVFCDLPADVFLAKGKEFKQLKPQVQFQKIIHQALIGDSFLHNFVVTYDLPHDRMIFAQQKQAN